MKRIITMFISCWAILSGFSQVIFFEDFGGVVNPPMGGPYGTPNAYGSTIGGPGSWTFAPGFLLRNVDNFTPNAVVNYINEAWEIREDFGLNVGNACAFSTSWYTPTGTANDWMWTSLIGPLPSNCFLSWKGRAYDPMYPDGYEVRIMTSSGTPGGPTGGPAVLGNQITNSTVVFSTAAEGTGTWVNHQVNLAAYTGQSIWVGFRNNSTDQFVLVIDDIMVEQVVNYDAQLATVNSISEYSKTPISQIAPLSLGGTITNDGLQTITNVALGVQVFDGANNLLYNTTGTVTPALASGSTAGFTAGTWTPPSLVDVYTIKYFPVLTEIDESAANDTIVSTFEITDTVYARDNGIVAGQLGIGAGNGGLLGNEFAIVDTARLTSVSIFMIDGFTGTNLAGVIWDMSGGYPNSIIAYTDTIPYVDDTISNWHTIPINGGDFVLNPGNYVVTLVEFDSTLYLGMADNIFTNTRSWVDWPTNPFSPWGNNESYGGSFAKIDMLRANLHVNCPPIIISGISGTIANCGINDGTAMVSVTGIGPFTYNWSDGSTADTTANLAPGTYSVIVTDITSGCYEMDSIIIVGTFPPTIGILSSTNETCVGCNNGSATALASGGTPGYTYLWSPSGGTNATAAGLAPGLYTITVTDSANCTDLDTITINAFVPNGIGDLQNGIQTMVYPNPSSGRFTVMGQLNYSGAIQVEVVDVLGSIVWTKQGDVNETLKMEVELNVRPGPYLLKINVGGKYIIHHLIIQ